jgi:hypothetical protein
MQQTCLKCGFTAETTAKFCRQCGAALFNESSASEAQTQHYGRQTPAPPVPEPASAPFTSQMPQQPPSIADTFAPDTGRLHPPQPTSGPPPFAGQYAPHAYPAPAYGQPPMPVAAKSNWWKWALGLVMGSVLVCGGCVTFGIYKAQQAVQNAPTAWQEVIDEAKRQAEAAAREAQREAANQPPQIGPDGKPLPPPPPLPGSDNTSPEVSALKYPNATQNNHVKVMGQEVLNMVSNDSFEQIKTFYQQKLGAPAIETNESGKVHVMFQKGQTMVNITARDEDNEINIIRSNLIPQIKLEQ